MLVDHDIRRQAMLRLFRHMGGAGSEAHRLEDFEQEWHRTGLRRGDLTQALREMVHDSLLLVARDRVGKTYKLTRRGIDQVRGEGAEAALARWRHRVALLYARWRHLFSDGDGALRGPMRDRRRH